jgi:hypothetical protein
MFESPPRFLGHILPLKAQLFKRFSEVAFCVLYKRLDGMGAKFVWPDSADRARDISVSQLELLMSGLSVDPPRGFSEIFARDF